MKRAGIGLNECSVTSLSFCLFYLAGQFFEFSIVEFMKSFQFVHELGNALSFAGLVFFINPAGDDASKEEDGQISVEAEGGCCDSGGDGGYGVVAKADGGDEHKAKPEGVWKGFEAWVKFPEECAGNAVPDDKADEKLFKFESAYDHPEKAKAFHQWILLTVWLISLFSWSVKFLASASLS